MEIYIDINSPHWFYYYKDSEGYKTTTEGFKTHIDAGLHCKEKFGEDIKIIYK